LHEVVVVGGGPAGLTAGMFCRMRKLSVLVLDAGRLGGQLVTMYPDKPVHDWPGHADINSDRLAAHLIEHALALGVEVVGNRKVTDLGALPDGALEVVAVDLQAGDEHRYPAKSVIIAIGGGAFEPRRLRVPGEDEVDPRFLTYRMPDRARVAGRQVVVVGGGDSGLESAQSAHLAGARVTMIQVLDHFTGMESNIELVRQMEIPCRFATRVRAIEVHNGMPRAVMAQARGAPEPERIECDYVVVNIGAAVNLDAVRRWGIDVEGHLIRVDGGMRTSRDGVFACGDIVTYEGKYKLLLTASSEGCVAANSAYVHVRRPPRLTMTELYS
jgi:thioredoxin reductase (NADPH)